MKNALKRGFTLVELLVVVLIIGILSSVALPQYQKAVKKARGVQIMTATSSLAKAMNMAYLEDGRYSREFGSYGGQFWPYNDEFDIEVPILEVSGEKHLWQLWGLVSNSSVATVTASKDDSDLSLTYHLSDGKISSITCSGSECSSYFPGTMLSSN